MGLSVTEIKRPTVAECDAAAERLRNIVVRSPLVPLHFYDGSTDILLKPEIHQVVGSFKIRGVFNAVACLHDDERQSGLSTVSAGNTAQALAWVGRHFGVPARSIMPQSAPASKVEAVRAYGGIPILVPTEEVFRFLREHAWEEEPYAFIHPWTNRDVMIGHGTMGLEIIADFPEVDSVYIPVGGGGLIAGLGSALKALKPSVRVVAVEPQRCPSFYASRAAGKPTTVECNTICDGVAVPYITQEMYPLIDGLADDAVLVPEDAVRSAIERLASRNKIVAEGSGALATAAALATPQDQRGRTVCIVTGGSIDMEKLTAILSDAPLS